MAVDTEVLQKDLSLMCKWLQTTQNRPSSREAVKELSAPWVDVLHSSMMFTHVGLDRSASDSPLSRMQVELSWVESEHLYLAPSHRTSRYDAGNRAQQSNKCIE